MTGARSVYDELRKSTTSRLISQCFSICGACPHFMILRKWPLGRSCAASSAVFGSHTLSLLPGHQERRAASTSLSFLADGVLQGAADRLDEPELPPLVVELPLEVLQHVPVDVLPRRCRRRFLTIPSRHRGRRRPSMIGSRSLSPIPDGHREDDTVDHLGVLRRELDRHLPAQAAGHEVVRRRLHELGEVGGSCHDEVVEGDQACRGRDPRWGASPRRRECWGRRASK